VSRRIAAEEQSIRVGGHDVEITRPAKVLFPADGITKGDLIDYYRRMAPFILAHLRDRPLAMERYPDGIDKESFFQKEVPSYFPDWIKRVTVKKAGGTVTHVVCNDEATLVYLANQACITHHTWLSRIDKLHHPDQMVFDLDPSREDFEAVKETALAIREMLDRLELPAYLKTTGSRGIHIAVPLKREEDFDSVRAFSRQLAEIVVNQDREQRTLEQSRGKRRGRVFVDTNRNAYAQHMAAAYAVRARPGAPVSAPLDWSELSKKDLRPDSVTIRTIFGRLSKVGDLWRDFGRRATSLKLARRKLEDSHGT
jgi:bifunctional non-homologous end joining protein LigD